MVAIHRNSVRLTWRALLGLTTVIVSLGTVRADGPAPEDGLFISVPNPITSTQVNRIKAKTERALQATDRRIRKIIYDFNPGNQASGTKDYGPCHDLADFIQIESRCGPGFRSSQSKSRRETKTDVNTFATRPITRVIAKPWMEVVPNRNRQLQATTVVT